MNPGTPSKGSSRDTRRRFEQWARNPRCHANAISAILDMPMREVAAKEGASGSFGQSPFALARGQQFERYAFADDARRLRNELERAGVLRKGSSGLADFRLRRASGPCASVDAAQALTTAWLQELADGTRTETIAAGPTICIPGGVMLPTATLCVDALAVRRHADGVELVVGEVKVYPDRKGFTDPTQLATSRAQAGMYVHGLRLVLKQLGLDRMMRVADRGFLVLSQAGTNYLSVRTNEDFGGQARRAEEGLAGLSECAQSLALESMPAAIALPVIQQAPTALCEDCLSFCERFEACRRRAVDRGDGAILGDAVQRFLGGTSLERVRQLHDGASPADAHESEIAELLAKVRRSHG
jgi:hypothetical protein